MNERTVHARSRHGVLIVRDSRGRWWQTVDPQSDIAHALPHDLPLTFEDACVMGADLGHPAGAVVFFGRPGGKMFDARVRAIWRLLDSAG
jgi:hypothetical protein